MPAELDGIAGSLRNASHAQPILRAKLETLRI
jgi:hypothetical protein